MLLSLKIREETFHQSIRDILHQSITIQKISTLQEIGKTLLHHIDEITIHIAVAIIMEETSETLPHITGKIIETNTLHHQLQLDIAQLNLELKVTPRKVERKGCNTRNM